MITPLLVPTAADGIKWGGGGIVFQAALTEGRCEHEQRRQCKIRPAWRSCAAHEFPLNFIHSAAKESIAAVVNMRANWLWEHVQSLIELVRRVRLGVKHAYRGTEWRN